MTDPATDELNSSSQIIEKCLNCEVEPRSHRWFDGFLRCLKPIWASTGKQNLHELKESKILCKSYYIHLLKFSEICLN